jgi:hypothetical protein
MRTKNPTETLDTASDALHERMVDVIERKFKSGDSMVGEFATDNGPLVMFNGDSFDLNPIVFGEFVDHLFSLGQFEEFFSVRRRRMTGAVMPATRVKEAL